MAWRSWDRPMVGTYYKLPDETSLQRGITYTILPDGRSLRVPSMSKLEVRAQSQSHNEDGDHDMMQALQDILMGKKPVAGRARMNQRGQAAGNRVGIPMGPIQDFHHGAGFRPIRDGARGAPHVRAPGQVM